MTCTASAGRLATFLVSACLATHASATAQRTFVSGSGVDNPACAITSPCRAFVAAIGATNNGGEIIVLDSAGYGAVTIAKSVSIIAPPGVYAGISVFPGFDGVVIDAVGATVVLRGLSINGQGGSRGIDIRQAAAVHIENCVVSRMASYGIAHGAPGGEVAVLDTIVRENTGSGIAVSGANASMVLHRVRSERNQGDGLSIIPPLGGQSHATASDSVFSFNNLHGVRADSPPGSTATASIDRSILSDNGDDGFRGTASSSLSGGDTTAVLTRNAIHRNAGFGVLIRTTVPGQARGFTNDNGALANGTGGFRVENSGAILNLAGNSGQGFSCQNAQFMISLGNNNVASFGASGCSKSLGGV